MSLSQNQPLTKQTKLCLLGILLLGFALRLLCLGKESLWVDELHTMLEAAPDSTWNSLMGYLNTIDQHPPMHFMIVKCCFKFFGYTAWSARIPSVIAGTLGIWALFYLGREMRNNRSGLLAALFAAINIFLLNYSQEARNYIFAFLFVILSFLYLVRTLKTLSFKNAVLYGIITAAFLYTHYFSLFAVAAQVVIIAIYFFAEPKENKARFFKVFLISALLIAIGYAPWFSHLLTMTNISSFWIKQVKPGFWVDFFWEYFDNDALVKFFAMIPGILYLYYSLRNSKGKINLHNIRQRPQASTFLILAIWIFVTQLIPYLRSVLLVPMMVARYTIVVTPAYFLILAFGIDMIPKPKWTGSIIILFVLLNITSLFFTKRYYTEVRKTQFREMVQYVVEHNKENYPVINEVTSWHQEYYFKLYHNDPVILPGKKLEVVDKILRKEPPVQDLKGFWILGAHFDTPMTQEQQKGLDTAYNLVLDQKWHDAWAQLWLKKEKP